MSARLSLNHSYFYDALSGAFEPPSDPEGRTHTLARLINATIEKGDVENPNSHRQLHTYRPSWAPISSIVHVSHWDIRSLTLDGEGRQLELVHLLDGQQHRGLRVTDTTHGDEPIIDARIGHEFGYFDLQERVKVIAQDFFDAFPKPEVVLV